ncbi:uncharacterized protein LOC129546722 isoform X3 [Moschus berezovskii]|uniref:uncharacterized protein LOC129546722 isoform X3 n=1 Tax=Moschus berezovskii TaxID=68408 RepID=UPI002444668E|nr:uncharacterized protein LOC129546722 isoform X3 [Moschus berezovskii]
MAPHSSTLAWEIPWTEEPGRLQSMGSLRAKSQTRLSNFTFTFHFMLWRRKHPLQCSCLENPRDGGAWWAAVYGVTQSRTQRTRLSSSSSRTISAHKWPCLKGPPRCVQSAFCWETAWRKPVLCPAHGIVIKNGSCVAPEDCRNVYSLTYGPGLSLWICTACCEEDCSSVTPQETPQILKGCATPEICQLPANTTLGPEASGFHLITKPECSNVTPTTQPGPSMAHTRAKVATCFTCSDLHHCNPLPCTGDRNHCLQTVGITVLGAANSVAWRNGTCVASKDCTPSNSISALTYSIGCGFWVNTTCCQGNCQEPSPLASLPASSTLSKFLCPTCPAGHSGPCSPSFFMPCPSRETECIHMNLVSEVGGQNLSVARLRHPRPVPEGGFPGAPGPPAGRPARLQRQATRHPGAQGPLGRGAWPPPRPAGADRRAGHRDPLLSHPACTPEPLLGASLLVPPDGALVPLYQGISRGLEASGEKVKKAGVSFLPQTKRFPKASPPSSRWDPKGCASSLGLGLPQIWSSFLSKGLKGYASLLRGGCFSSSDERCFHGYTFSFLLGGPKSFLKLGGSQDQATPSDCISSQEHSRTAPPSLSLFRV